MLIAVLTKPPNSVNSYTMDWSDLGETVTSSSWSVPSGLTQVSGSFGASSSFIQVSGGVACNTYEVTNFINTSSGQTSSRSVVFHFRSW